MTYRSIATKINIKHTYIRTYDSRGPIYKRFSDNIKIVLR